MKRSTERFLTTHTGSLPRPDDLIRMMYAKEEGVPVDRGALAERVRAAVAEVVQKQAEAGVDLVNDGEMSKPSYATYIKDRLNGFGGTGNTFVYQDLADFPKLAQSACSAIPAARGARRPPATRRSACAIRERVRTDVDNLKAALAGAGGRDGFMSAASPGVVSLFFRNDHYKDYETLSLRDRRRDARTNTRPSRKAGFVLQFDCPDLAMGRHIQYADLDLAAFRKRTGMHIEALNHALAEHPARAAAPASVLGQLRGPAPLRRAACRHHRHRVHGAAGTPSRSKPPIRAMPTNGRCSSA